MLAKIRKARRMMTAEEELAFVRPHVVEAIEALRARGISQMRAYAKLAGMVGKSPTWVRGVISRDASIGVRFRDAVNIARAYRTLCSRIEAAADADEVSNNKLREELDVALSGAATPHRREVGKAVAQAAAARGPRRSTASALVGSRTCAGVPANQPPADVNDLPLWRAIEGE